MAARALIFDLDGTLWRGHEWYARTLAGLAQTDEAALLARLAGGESAIRLADEFGVPRSRFLRAAERGVSDLRLYDGVRECIDDLRARGTPLGVVTSLSRSLGEVGLRHHGLSRQFDATEFAAGGKTQALRRIAASIPGDSDLPIVYVADLPGDALAARQAGVHFAWASWGYSTSPVSAVAMLQTFTDVLEL